MNANCAKSRLYQEFPRYFLCHEESIVIEDDYICINSNTENVLQCLKFKADD